MFFIRSVAINMSTKLTSRKRSRAVSLSADPDYVGKKKRYNKNTSLSRKAAHKCELIIMRTWLARNAWYIPSDDLEEDITVVASVFVQFLRWLDGLGRRPIAVVRSIRILKLHLALSCARRGLSLRSMNDIWRLPHQTIRDGMATDLIPMVLTSPVLPPHVLGWIGERRPIYKPRSSKHDGDLREVIVDVAAAESFILVPKMFPKAQLMVNEEGTYNYFFLIAVVFFSLKN